MLLAWTALVAVPAWAQAVSGIGGEACPGRAGSEPEDSSLLQRKAADARRPCPWKSSSLWAVGGSCDPKAAPPTLTNCSKVEILSPAQGSAWREGPPLSQGRFFLSLAVLDDAMYAIGGFSGQTLQSVEVLRRGAAAWKESVPLPSPRRGMGAATFGGRIYAVGGAEEIGQVTALTRVESFDGTQWRTEPSLTVPRQNLAVAVFQDKLYAMGGSTCGKANDCKCQSGSNCIATNSVEVFDGESWSAAPSMVQYRNSFGAAVFDGKLFVAGGACDPFELTRPAPFECWGSTLVEAFDGTRWSLYPQMDLGFGGGSRVAALGSALFVGGGEDQPPCDFVGCPCKEKGGCANPSTWASEFQAFDGARWHAAPSLLVGRQDYGLAVF